MNKNIWLTIYFVTIFILYLEIKKGKIMKQNKIEKFLGKEDAVFLQRLSKRIFKYKCPEYSYKKTVTNLRRHLEARHKWSKEQA